MPLQNPYDAVQSLLGATSNPDMIKQRLQQEANLEELKRHLGLEQEDKINSARTGAPRTAFYGALPTDVAHAQDTLNESPNFGVDEQARVKGLQDAQDSALAQGFTGGTDILSGRDMSDGGNMFAGNQDVGTPVQQRLHTQMAAEAYKENSAARAATAKAQAEAQGIRETNQFNYNLQHPGAAPLYPQAPGAPGAPQVPSGPTQPAQPPPVAPKSPFQNVKDFLTNSGSQPYNGLKDLLGAKTESALSGIAATPETSAIQNNLLGNAQSLAGIFPSSRAAGVLSKIAQEFQANYGHETPQNSYQRVKNQIDSLQDAEREFDDPSLSTKFDASGRMEITNSNQTIQRAKLAVDTSRKTLMKALHQIEILHPGIGSAGVGGRGQVPAGGAPPAGRFERLPEDQ